MENTSTATPYVMDYDWVWTRNPSHTRTLRVFVMHRDPVILRDAVAGYLNSLPHDSNYVAGNGGWAIFPRMEHSRPTKIALDIVSGGEDVADGIEDGAQTTFEALGTIPGVTFCWQQLAV